MLDLLVCGGTVIDGTGSAGRRADLGIADGRIVAIGEPGSLGASEQAIDASGLVVTPGFIDLHTHLDAQVFWDAACTPLPFHGITTAIGGNCGFSVAPSSAADADYLMRMLASVEEIPLTSLRSGVPWDWHSTAEYLARVEAASPSINLGFMVGHSAIRRVVMGESAIGERASAAQIDAMKELLRACLREGGLGFSSSWQTVHSDGEGEPVPSRWASGDEIVDLCSVVSEFEGTHVEFIPDIAGTPTFGPDLIDLLTRMSIAADRIVNWNIFIPGSRLRDATMSQLAASDAVAAGGGRLVALSYPGVMKVRRSLQNARYGRLPGWSEVMALPIEERKKAFADPERRSALAAAARTPLPDGTIHDLAHWEDLVVAETFVETTRHYEGRRVGDIAEEQGRDPFDVFCDLVVSDDMRTGFTPPEIAADEESWEIRVASWTDPRVVLGAGDAGAHLGTLATYDWPSEFLSQNRERGVMALEEAVRLITSVPADLYGLRDRGRLIKDAYADIVVFDPVAIRPEPARWRDDLPGGAGRLFGVAEGIANVLVNGKEVVRDGTLVDTAPGRVLRSGSDTMTVALPDLP